MVEIINGPTKRERKEFTCFKCGTVYQADQWDYLYSNPNGKWGYQIPCPICGDNSWHFRLDRVYHSWENPQYRNVKDV